MRPSRRITAPSTTRSFSGVRLSLPTRSSARAVAAVSSPSVSLASFLTGGWSGSSQILRCLLPRESTPGTT